MYLCRAVSASIDHSSTRIIFSTKTTIISYRPTPAADALSSMLTPTGKSSPATFRLAILNKLSPLLFLRPLSPARLVPSTTVVSETKKSGASIGEIVKRNRKIGNRPPPPPTAVLCPLSLSVFFQRQGSSTACCTTPSSSRLRGL